MAFDLPTKRVRRWEPPTPGITPSVISGCPNFAFSAVAGNRRDDRLAAVVDALVGRADEVLAVDLGEGHRLHLLDVRTRREGLFRPCDHYAADVVIGLEQVEGHRELFGQGDAQGVERMGTIESDEPDGAAGLDDDVFISHKIRLVNGCRKYQSASPERHA
jgi:hypothetical protein